jgi:hypothetical protein
MLPQHAPISRGAKMENKEKSRRITISHLAGLQFFQDNREKLALEHQTERTEHTFRARSALELQG